MSLRISNVSYNNINFYKEILLQLISKTKLSLKSNISQFVNSSSWINQKNYLKQILYFLLETVLVNLILFISLVLSATKSKIYNIQEKLYLKIARYKYVFKRIPSKLKNNFYIISREINLSFGYNSLLYRVKSYASAGLANTSDKFSTEF